MSRDLINSELIDFYRTLTNHKIYINFDEDTKQIVPDNLEHSQLLKKFVINESILEYYFLPTKYLLSDDELEDVLSYTYVENIKLLQQPYNVAILGAYNMRNAFIYKLQSFIIGKESTRPRINGKIPQYFDELKPYFNEYSKGFKTGFECFENDEIKPFLTLLADKQDFINKVFEFIVLPKADFYDTNWFDAIGFYQDQDREIIKGFESGKREGYFYKAWCLVLSNSNSFAPLFNDLLKNGKLIENKNTEPQQIESFSVPEWATIFYYADSANLLSGNNTDFFQKKLDCFIEKHNIKRSKSNLKNEYYTIRNKINVELNYPIEKLNKILPFMNEHYKQSIGLINNDITYLEEK